ncbi:beta-glucosidase [Pochonia chlamydosporia 170]|uniref:Beta-glucosidase cel3A n=1 Tax=Pochonia chlamydosporia 170 TaxID=1380566 RepID=A0A179EYE2_METCM|nr:beta-glucosidase [Pochonia chlamydosporia 170]OAQ58172.1 beta-glucosidase [Pochonia chlamydosporia 170]
MALASPVLSKAGDGDWAGPYAKAIAALPRLSQQDKISMVTGFAKNEQPCTGLTAVVPSIGYPRLCLQDGPLAVKNLVNATVFPAGIQAASTWDTSLIYSRGFALGAESKAAGVHVLLGPAGGPLGKIPTGGRNWEGFSPDPYLTGIAMANTINGMQAAGVQACAKHVIGNEQEQNREGISSNIDDRTNHELYLWPFADAIKANVSSIMCSYNKVNRTHACENKQLLQGLLKDELDFQGYIMSDWGAQHSTAESANAGLDMAFPYPEDEDAEDGLPKENDGLPKYWDDKLTNAISSNNVSQSRLDDMVTRILAGWYLVGQDSGYPPPSNGSVIYDPNDHKMLARKIARDGIVLLKNDNNTLPLKKSDRLAIIGTTADKAVYQGGGSGGADAPQLVAPLDAIMKAGTVVANSTSNDPSNGATAANAAATAVVFLSSYSGEAGMGDDRSNLNPDKSGNELVEAVSKTGKPTIVVIHSVGPLILETIWKLPNVVSIVWAGLPGQESGNALVDVLYGQISPSGKLPYTIARNESDYGTYIIDDDQGYQDNFTEGLYIDYRHFDKEGLQPRFAFGFGLSYTTFDYSDLESVIDAPPGNTTLIPGGKAGLYDTVATVSATITNTGKVTGAEVAQLYVGLPPSSPDTPIKQLRGFTKISLNPGERGTVTFKLRCKDLSYWDVRTQAWVMPSGTFNVSVGASSRDIRLTDTISLV